MCGLTLPLRRSVASVNVRLFAAALSRAVPRPALLRLSPFPVSVLGGVPPRDCLSPALPRCCRVRATSRVVSVHTAADRLILHAVLSIVLVWYRAPSPSLCAPSAPLRPPPSVLSLQPSLFSRRLFLAFSRRLFLATLRSPQPQSDNPSSDIYIYMYFFLGYRSASS